MKHIGSLRLSCRNRANCYYRTPLTMANVAPEFSVEIAFDTTKTRILGGGIIRQDGTVFAYCLYAGGPPYPDVQLEKITMSALSYDQAIALNAALFRRQHAAQDTGGNLLSQLLGGGTIVFNKVDEDPEDDHGPTLNMPPTENPKDPNTPG